MGKILNKMNILITETQFNLLKIKRRVSSSDYEILDQLMNSYLESKFHFGIVRRNIKLHEFIMLLIRDVISDYISEFVEHDSDDDDYVDNLYETYTKYLTNILYDKYSEKITKLYYKILDNE
jgi:hypothetical protein